MMRFDKINPAATQYAMNTTMPMIGDMKQNMSRNIIIVYTPRVIPSQVVRPYVIDDSPVVKSIFANEISNKLLSNTSRISTDLKLKLLPHSMGYRLNDEVLSSKYTFTLITNNTTPMIPGMENPSSVKRVYCGYFTDQPFSDQFLNGFDVDPVMAINPNAFMIVTDTIVRSSAEMMHASGKRSRNRTSVNDSLFSAPIIQFTPEPDMFLMTNDTLLSSEVYAIEQPNRPSSMTANINHMASIIANPCAIAVENKFKNPTEQLKDLVNAEYSHQLYKDDDMVCFENDAVGQHVASRIGIVGKSYGAIQVNEPIPVKDMVSFVSPEIQVVKMADAPGYNVKDQGSITLDVQLSSLVTHTVSSILSENAVLSGTILYQSCQPTQIALVEEPAWSIQDMVLDGVGMTEMDILRVQNRVMDRIQLDVCDVIKAIAGDFEMIVSYTGGGDCLVDLTLMDFGGAGGFTATPNVFGGVISPLLGTRSHVEHNALRVNQMVM